VRSGSGVQGSSGAAGGRGLSSDGIAVVCCPAGTPRKTDAADATSVGIVALTATGLRTVEINEALIALRALVEHRDDLVKTRTQVINRLHVLLTQLIPAGAPTRLSAETTAELLRTVRPRTPMLRTVRPRTPMLRTLRSLASDLITEIRRLDRRIIITTTEITTAVAASGSTLTQLHGIGNLLAGKILARVGDIDRFRSAAAFASYTATAPIEVSSGDVVRHRLSRAGDRQLTSSPAHPWPSPRSPTTLQAAPITSANAPPERATGKRCAA
jgi:transposase